MSNILVADIMTKEPISIKPDTNLLDCAKQMVRKRVGSLLILNKKKLVGFISQRDILWALIKKSKEGISKIKAIDISPKKIGTIKPSASMKQALQKMKKLKFERLPVIYNGELVGIITARDILNFNPEFYPELEEFAEIREESKKLKRVKKARNRDIIRDGLCEECGNHNLLQKVDGMFLCQSCISSR